LGECGQHSQLDKFLGELLKPALSLVATNPYNLRAPILIATTLIQFGIVR
jgi:hypothetical protein